MGLGHEGRTIMKKTPLETPGYHNFQKGPKDQKDSRAIKSLMVTTILNLLINDTIPEMTGSKNIDWWAISGPI